MLPMQAFIAFDLTPVLIITSISGDSRPKVSNQSSRSTAVSTSFACTFVFITIQQICQSRPGSASLGRVLCMACLFNMKAIFVCNGIQWYVKY